MMATRFSSLFKAHPFDLLKHGTLHSNLEG
jgi:hypothetical protein